MLALDIKNPIPRPPRHPIEGNLDGKRPHRHRDHELHLQIRHLLPDAVPRPELERPPGALDRVERVAFLDEPALRHELVDARPQIRTAVDGLADDPDVEALGRQAAAVGRGHEESFFAAADAGGGREEPQGFFDDGEGVVELVEDVGVLADDGAGFVDLGTEDGVEFFAEFGVDGGVLGEEIVDVTDGGGGGVVAGEDEGFDEIDGDGLEFLVEALFWVLFDFCLVGVDGDVDDWFAAFFGLRFLGILA